MSLPSDLWFHPDRKAHYLRHSGGDPFLADRLCEWDRRLRHAIFRDVEELHHALMAAYSAAFDRRWNGAGDWLRDRDGPLRAPVLRSGADLNERMRREIAEAVRRTGDSAATNLDVLAKLSLGSWLVMTSKGREQDLWIPYIRFAYPRHTQRTYVHSLVGTFRDLRNKVCHHESLLSIGPGQHHQLTTLCGLLVPGMRARFEQQSAVPLILRQRPRPRR